MIEKYCENNKFNRVRFALDVKNGKISSRELSTVFRDIVKCCGLKFGSA